MMPRRVKFSELRPLEERAVFANVNFAYWELLATADVMHAIAKLEKFLNMVRAE